MIRKIFLSPFNMGSFTAFNKIEEIDYFKIYSPDIQFNTFLYSSLLETGANYIEIVNGNSLFEGSRTIRDRIIRTNEKKYANILLEVKNLFGKYDNKLQKNKKLSEALELTRIFLTDLLYSTHIGSDFIYYGDVPNLSPYKDLIQPDLFYPINSLLSSITSKDLFISSPISYIPKERIKTFDQIIKSDIYQKYSHAHSLLNENNLSRLKDTLKLRSEKLVASNPTLLGIYNNATSILGIADLINPRLGQIAKIAQTVLTKNTEANNRQNISIYMYKNLLLERFKTKYKITESRFADDLIKWSIEAAELAIKEKVKKEQFLSFIKKHVLEQKDKKLGRKT